MLLAKLYLIVIMLSVNKSVEINLRLLNKVTMTGIGEKWLNGKTIKQL